jgi:hypothetical protein
MRRMISFCLLLLSLLALVTPSLAAISLGPTLVAGAAMAVGDEGVTAPALKPCQLQGGKRVLPCNPDRAVLSQTALAPQPTASAPLPLPEEQRPRSLAPSVDPPPPRRF